jgi:uncharacterized protein
MMSVPNLRTTFQIAVVACVAWTLLPTPVQAQQGEPRTGPDASRGSASAAPSGPSSSEQAKHDELVRFVRVVLATTEDVWGAKFREAGNRYERPKLLMYSDRTPSPCGMGDAVTGPFYCPADRKIYLEKSFLHALELRFLAPGNFAQAYVIAHEVGHHVQALLGIEKRVSAAQSNTTEQAANQLNVRLELQADCFAGIWASWVRQTPNIEHGDIEAAIRATQALGDDTIQKRTAGTVVLDSFTHGSGEQRARWFKRGLDSGEIRQCNTFGAPEL